MTRENLEPSAHFCEKVSQRMPEGTDARKLWFWIIRMRSRDNEKALRFIMRSRADRCAYEFWHDGKRFWVIFSEEASRPVTIYNEGMSATNAKGKRKYVGGRSYAPPKRLRGRRGKPVCRKMRFHDGR